MVTLHPLQNLPPMSFLLDQGLGVDRTIYSGGCLARQGRTVVQSKSVGIEELILRDHLTTGFTNLGWPLGPGGTLGSQAAHRKSAAGPLILLAPPEDC